MTLAVGLFEHQQNKLDKQRMCCSVGRVQPQSSARQPWRLRGLLDQQELIINTRWVMHLNDAVIK